jgi:hypothetical protein
MRYGKVFVVLGEDSPLRVEPGPYGGIWMNGHVDEKFREPTRDYGVWGTQHLVDKLAHLLGCGE